VSADPAANNKLIELLSIIHLKNHTFIENCWINQLMVILLQSNFREWKKSLIELTFRNILTTTNPHFSDKYGSKSISVNIQ